MIPCDETPGKDSFPVRPECLHGPMLANGANWVCRERRRQRYLDDPERHKDYVRAWRADAANRERERRLARERYARREPS